MKVLKFGGSSVANVENIEKVVEIVRNAVEKDDCAVVLSAMQGTTDALIDAAKTAERKDESFRGKIEEIENKHFQTVRALIPNEEQTETLNFPNKNLDELKSICEGVFLLGELT